MIHSAPFFYRRSIVQRFIFLFTAIIFLSACTKAQTPLVAISGETMGTTYNIKYVNHQAQGKAVTASEVKADVDALLVKTNQLMSTYITDSELSQLNKSVAGTAYPISAQTEYVIEEAIRLNTLSQGKLDITVGPLVNLWGFGPQARPDSLPSHEALDEVSKYVGIDKFTLENGMLTKHHDLVYIDLSTIAKGYAVDKIAQLLESKSIHNYLVEIGGEMRVAGTKPHNQNWLIAIEKPITHERGIQRIIHIGDNAIASSGDYRNYFEEAGVRYSHLIDPTTAYPIQHNLVAVSVVAKTSISADGLATALIVMGKNAGLEMAEANNIAALFITKEGDEFVEYTTSAFNAQVTIID